MNTSTLMVKDLLPRDLDVEIDQLALGEGGALTAGAAAFMKDRLRAAIGEGLQIDVVGILAEAWAGAAEVRKAASAEGKGKPTSVFLGKHDVVCENKLGVILEFAGAPAVTGHLGLTLRAKFEGVGLTIDSGCIVAIEAGRGAAQVELKYSSTKLVSTGTDWVVLPVALRLDRPVRVAAFEAARDARSYDDLPKGVTRLPDTDARARMAL